MTYDFSNDTDVPWYMNKDHELERLLTVISSLRPFSCTLESVVNFPCSKDGGKKREETTTNIILMR
jgi:hypothetical protein